MGTKANDYPHPDELPKLVDLFKKRMAGEDIPNVYETMLLSKEGKKLNVEVNVGVISYIGKPADLVIYRDISARKKAEEALRESQAKLQSIFSAAPAGIGMTINQTIGELNARLCEITGYSKEELSGKSISVVYPSNQDYLSARSESHDQLREKGHSTIEASWKRKDSRLISVLLSCALLKPGDFSQGITFTVLDITERKKAEEALRASEQRYRLLFERNLAAVYRTTLDGTVLDCNESFVRLLGYDSREEVMACCASEFYFDVADREGFIEKLRRQGTLTNFEFRMRRRDGSSVWILENVSLIEEEEGVPAYTQGTSIDITERKRAEELLRTSEAQLSNAMKIAKLGYWEYDVAKDLFTFNDHFYAIFRTTAEQVGGYTMSSARYAELFVHPDDMAVVGIEIQKALETTDPHFSRQLEHRIIYADGETGYIAVRFFIVKDDQGRTVKTYGANQDITERKKAEEAIRTERDKLENVTKNIGVGLAIVSKDYQTVWANEF